MIMIYAYVELQTTIYILLHQILSNYMQPNCSHWQQCSTAAIANHTGTSFAKNHVLRPKVIVSTWISLLFHKHVKHTSGLRTLYYNM